MARAYARLLTSIWGDEDWKILASSDQRAYLLALSQAHLSLVGAVAYQPRRWGSFAADTNEIMVRRAVARLEAAEFVAVDHDTEELLIRSFVRYDSSLRYPNTSKGVASAYHRVASDQLRKLIQAELMRLFEEEPDLNGWRVPELIKIVQDGFGGPPS